MGTKEIYLPDLVGAGYRDFWHFTGRYRVVKGGRGSKKSKTTALNLIWRMLMMKESNTLVVRRTYRSLRDSCYAELKWAVERLGVTADWRFREDPLEMEYLPTGQRIYFRGMDDPQKLASIVAARGYLCFVWVEEAYEIAREEDFALLDESVRGDLPSELFKQITLTFNPWNESHWLKRRFFDVPPSADILAMTVDYRCNEFLDAADLRMFEDMARREPRRYRVAGLGEWGSVGGLVYENWRVEDFAVDEVVAKARIKSVFGLDFGYVNDPTALFCGLLDEEGRRLYVFDELYERGLSNERIYEEVVRRGYAKERIMADGAEPKSIDRLRELGLRRIAAAKKGPGSILAGIDYLQGLEMIIKPCCVNFLREIGAYSWREKDGRYLNDPIDENNHLMDAMRYGVSAIRRGNVYSW